MTEGSRCVKINTGEAMNKAVRKIRDDTLTKILEYAEVVIGFPLAIHTMGTEGKFKGKRVKFTLEGGKLVESLDDMKPIL